MQFVPEMQPFQGEAAYSRNEAAEYFREAAAAVSMPFVYLSAGVSNSAFIEGLEFALQSGVRFHGVLCGRATWQEGVPIFVKRGASALQDWLRSSGAANLAKVNRVLESATPWQEAASAAASSLV
jgi:tagatose 1,6-diphosphate aldolase